MATSDPKELYDVRSLRPGPARAADVARALSLVHTAKPSVTMEEWTHHVEQVMRDADDGAAGHGMRLLVGPNDYVYGLFSYRTVRTIGAGLSLQLDDFCVTPIVSRRSATSALLREAERIARRFDCSAIAVNFLDEEVWDRPEPPHEAFAFDGGFMPAPPCVMKKIA